MNAAEFVIPDYVLAMQKSERFAGKSVAQIELRLAATKGVESLTGLTNHQHRTNALKWLFPSRINNPWRERLVRAYDLVRRTGRKELMILGASNSTKTSTFADLLIEIWLECPEATSIYITSPYEDATETGLWARVLEQFQEAQDHNPELPGKLKLSECKIILAENNPLSFIKVVSIDQVGKLVGRKAKRFNVGMMIIAADELPEFRQQGLPLKRVMANLISVPNMVLMGAGNFAFPTDALGVFSEPAYECDNDGKQGEMIPGGYEGLRVERHKEWISTRNGLVIRFDGDDSPALEDPETFFFLPTAAYRDQLAMQSGGRTSADYFRFWHSFPLVRADEFTVTNLNKVRSSGALDEHYEWTGDSLVTGAHCDPGFGGDPAILQPWRMGFVRTKDGSRLQVFEAWGAPLTIPIDVSADAKTTPEEQIVKFHRDFAERQGIPEDCCSFDGSMRSQIVQDYAKWSLRVVAIDSFGSATDRPVSVIKEITSDGNEREAAVWKDKVANFITELWMAAASLFISGQIRGLLPAADSTVKQLCQRRWQWVGKKKKQVETKKEYKDNNSGKSPNEADALVGGIEIARRKGLKLNGVTAKDGGSLALLKSIIEGRQTQKAMKGSVTGFRSLGLPSGQLHGISRQKTGRTGRLNR